MGHKRLADLDRARKDGKVQRRQPVWVLLVRVGAELELDALLFLFLTRSVGPFFG